MQQKRVMVEHGEGRGRMRLLLALMLCLLPLAGSQPLVMRVLLCLGMLAIYLLALLFWAYFIPNRAQGNMRLPRLAAILLGRVFRRGDAIRRVTEGTFDPDYFALRSKPHIPALAVDADSAVVIQQADGKHSVLAGGLWALEKGDSIAHVFDLRAARLTIGPDTRANPLSASRHEGSSLRGAKALGASMQQTRCQTKDGVTLVPVIEIIFRLKSNASDAQWNRHMLTLSAYLEGRQATGNATAHIEELLSAVVSAHLKDTIAEIAWADLAQQSRTAVQLNAYLQALAGIDKNFIDKLLPRQLRGIFITSVMIKKVWTA